MRYRGGESCDLGEGGSRAQSLLCLRNWEGVSACADTIVPFWKECGFFITNLSASTFAFDIEEFGRFAGNCHHTRALVHFSSGECISGPDELQARLADIQESCCVQEGTNVCREGTPWACDAECAVPFMTFFSNCIEPGVMNVADLTSYRTLYVRQLVINSCRTTHVRAQCETYEVSALRVGESNIPPINMYQSSHAYE